MLAIFFSFLAAACATLSNLIFRKRVLSSNLSAPESAKIDNEFEFPLPHRIPPQSAHAEIMSIPLKKRSLNRSSSGLRQNQKMSDSNFYLCCFYFFSFLFSLTLVPWSEPLDLVLLGIGSCVGFLNVLIMRLTMNALKEGPSGLTFAFLNASAVLPGLLLFLLLGNDHGFQFSYFQLIGVMLVISGLFIEAKNSARFKKGIIASWLKYALGSFLLQTVALTCIQGRYAFFETLSLTEIEASSPHTDMWFMPGQFGTSFLFQCLLFWKERHTLRMYACLHGFFGGSANFASTFFLLLATKMALPGTKIILFPTFAVFSILLCNLWTYKFYQENFNYKANLMCAFGIFIGVF
jgi:hypothetical protein